MRVLVLSSVFPSAVRPSYGVFVKERIAALSALPGVELVVISPTPYVPPVRALRERYLWWKFPADENLDGIRILRPRYPLPPRLGGYFHSDLMYRAAARVADRLWQERPFDLIDSHFVFPNGAVAARLGKRYRVPVVVTGRGEDMLRFPSLPVIGKKIRKALQSDVWCVALSDEIAAAFKLQGAPPERITKIPNGIDLQTFRPIPTAEARASLGLPSDRRIIVSVGNLQERKGFHLLVDALPAVRRKHPDAYLVIVGGPAPYGADYTQIILHRIKYYGLENDVRLAGHQSHGDLATWYSAADVFALLSSREGSPNVLLEALACGTPSVATSVGGIPEELADSELGILLAGRTATAATDSLNLALSRTWDRAYIRQRMEERSWESVALKVHSIFERAINSRSTSIGR